MEKVHVFRKTFATHLADLGDPLLGRDPQFGKRWLKPSSPGQLSTYIA